MQEVKWRAVCQDKEQAKCSGTSVEAAWHYGVAGRPNPRPKYSLLVSRRALFIVVVNDTRGSD